MPGAFQEIREELGSFCDYIWSYVDRKTILYNGYSGTDGKIPVSNRLSKRISKYLKNVGFKREKLTYTPICRLAD